MPEKNRCSNVGAREKSTGQRPSAILIAALVALLSLLPALYAWTVRFVLCRNLRSLSEGDFEPLFGTYADDIRFVFPGHNSWAGKYRGREAVERWVRRVYQVGLRLEPREILVMGPPWDTTVCLRFTDRCTAPDGTIVYTNRGMVFGKIAWGKITYYEIHEDTEKVVALDEYVASHEPTGA
jgi:ketosteroid isomerase-like protein